MKIVATVLPQVMTFTDRDGIEHQIFLELGTHEEAGQLATKEDWETLKSWPKYGMYWETRAIYARTNNPSSRANS